MKAPTAEEFYKVKNTTSYKKFEYEYLENYYGSDFFTDTVNGKIPVFTLPYGETVGSNYLASNSIKDFDFLGDKKDLSCEFSIRNHQKYKKGIYYKNYHSIVGSKIKFPDRLGFMLKEFNCDEDGKMVGFSGYVGTYAENVYSTHILEYELFKLYQERDKGYEYLIKNSTLRNSMHKLGCCAKKSSEYNDAMYKSLCRGYGRDSLLGVQMLVLIKHGSDYDIKVIQRSKNVAVAPECFQLVPSGGFEIMSNSNFPCSKDEIEDNYSVGCAVFREYLEEIFGIDEFKGNEIDSVNEALLKDERILAVNKLIKEKKADFCFLGSTLNLAGLRHELSFLLVIYDEKYNESNTFLGNEECKNKNFISNVTVSNFEEREDIWNNLHGPSGAMWMLFKNSSIYQKVMNDISQNSCSKEE